MLGHDHEGRTQQAAVEHIALLEHLHHAAGRRAGRVGLADGLVVFGVERFAGGVQHRQAIDGGTVIYSLPTNGPLDDSSYTMPGSVRARAEDLDAIVPNVTKGMVVYFY